MLLFKLRLLVHIVCECVRQGRVLWLSYWNIVMGYVMLVRYWLYWGMVRRELNVWLVSTFVLIVQKPSSSRYFIAAMS